MTRRESQISVLVHRGMTDPQIAAALGISVNTVRGLIKRAEVRLRLHGPNPRLQLALRVERALTDCVLADLATFHRNAHDLLNTHAQRISA